MLCKCYWIVLYTVHFTAFCLGGLFSRTRCSTYLLTYTYSGRADEEKLSCSISWLCRCNDVTWCSMVCRRNSTTHAQTSAIFLLPVTMCIGDGLGVADVDGSWSSWTPWSECSALCGGGTRSRLRLCDSPAASGTGRECEGHSQQMSDCNSHSCQVSPLSVCLSVCHRMNL